ncbi:MAG: outer membrane protein assembly factor BamD [Calditrichia bacterium]
MRKLFFFLLLAVMTFVLSQCGHKVNRAELDAQAYFEYAKSLFEKGKYYDAINEFGVITLKFSGSPVVDDAQYYLAESHFMNEEYLIAVAEYQKLLDDYPESPYVEDAFYKIGLSYQNMSQRPELDQEYTRKALKYYQNYIEAYPEGKKRKEAEKNIAVMREKLSQKQLLGGEAYRKMGIYDSAIIYYDLLLERYYDTPQAATALFRKAECQYKLQKYEEALSNLSAFIEKHPEHKSVKDAKKLISKIQALLNTAEASN